ncbi:MAG TPA: hypothetical protein VK821_10895 [Dehalococcoidia bacterium]|nr:hypothetical protein [Dehalococcoidia bacterium]
MYLKPAACNSAWYSRTVLTRAFGAIGTPDDFLQRLRELQEAGFDEVYMQTVGTMNFPDAEIRAFGETIGPALSASARVR